MKQKLNLLIPILISAYGFLPISFSYDKSDLTKPNNLLIHHQECGCPCPNAFIKEGQLIIPDSIRNSYSNIYKKEINITGNDPFEPYNIELSTKDMIVSGKVVGVDTVLCDPSGCQVVPVFKVDDWKVASYVPRLWTHGKTFFFIFLFSVLTTGIIILMLFARTVVNLAKRTMKKLSTFALAIILSSTLNAQDTISTKKLHSITSDDLIYEWPKHLNGVYTKGKDPNKRELHFKDSLHFEEYVYFGVDSLETSPGTYNYDPAGWLVLTNVDAEIERFALLRFYKFMFLVQESEMEKFKKDFITEMRKLKYSPSTDFKPDPRILKACEKLSKHYFVMKIIDP